MFVPALAAGAAISPEAAAGALALSAGALAILNEILDGADDPAAKAKADAGKTKEECEEGRCKEVLESCRQKCLDIYVDNPNSLPGSGSDRTGRMRRCIRECMMGQNCNNF